jgi:hypothetical protein
MIIVLDFMTEFEFLEYITMTIVLDHHMTKFSEYITIVLVLWL